MCGMTAGDVLDAIDAFLYGCGPDDGDVMYVADPGELIDPETMAAVTDAGERDGCLVLTCGDGNALGAQVIVDLLYDAADDTPVLCRVGCGLVPVEDVVMSDGYEICLVAEM